MQIRRAPCRVLKHSTKRAGGPRFLKVCEKTSGETIKTFLNTRIFRFVVGLYIYLRIVLLNCLKEYILQYMTSLNAYISTISFREGGHVEKTIDVKSPPFADLKWCYIKRGWCNRCCYTI